MPGIKRTGLHLPRMNLILLSGELFVIPYSDFNKFVASFSDSRHSFPEKRAEFFRLMLSSSS